jgi:tetratricopeptide (TPR) repeat protein
VSIPGDLERARLMAFAADEAAARDLLVSLVPAIEAADRDDYMLEVFAQMGEICIARSANDGLREAIRSIRDCLAIYAGIAAGTMPEHAERVRMSDADIAHMACRYSRRAAFLDAGLAAADGDHDGAGVALAALEHVLADFPDLAEEHAHLVMRARVLWASALCDDDLHVQAAPLWERVLEDLDRLGDGPRADHVRVAAATAYGRFCVETGRLAEAEPWLQRASARAQSNGWELAAAQAQLERAAASWSARDRATTETLASQAYPVVARYQRAHDMARCLTYLGFTRLAYGAMEAADECWAHAERCWRDLGKPLHLHRILLQRSWISIYRGRFADAVELIAQARQWLESSPRSSWLQYARLDNHLGTVWRVDALTDLGFDAAGDPSETWREAEARQAAALGVIRADPDGPEFGRAAVKFEQAAELKVPAALAVDSVRYSIADADARSRWAAVVSAPMLAGAFAVAWEWDNTELVSELVEYHSARGTFGAEVPQPDVNEWETTATPTPLLDPGGLIIDAVASADGAASLTRLGPLPPLRMQPGAEPILSRYRELAQQRYGRTVTATEPAWSTWP